MCLVVSCHNNDYILLYYSNIISVCCASLHPCGYTSTDKNKFNAKLSQRELQVVK